MGHCFSNSFVHDPKFKSQLPCAPNRISTDCSPLQTARICRPVNNTHCVAAADAPQPSVRWVPCVRYLGLKLPGREVLSPPSIAEGTNEWSCTAATPVCTADVQKDSFLFTIHWIAVATYVLVAALGLRIPALGYGQ